VNKNQICNSLQAEYTILENGDGDSPHVQKANIPVEKGGYLIYGTTHIHSGIVNVTLYGQVMNNIFHYSYILLLWLVTY